MLTFKRTITGVAAAALLLSACETSSTTHQTPESLLPPPAGVFIKDLDAVARSHNLIGNHGSNYSYLDEAGEGAPILIHETFSSRTKYKILTPILGSTSENLVVNCSLIRSTEGGSEIAVGNYCRGESPASIDTIEDAINDQWTMRYSTSLPWLRDVSLKLPCEHAMGLEDGSLRALRCRSTTEEDETTESVTTYILSITLEPYLTMAGYEFAGTTENGESLIFWRMDKAGQHELAERATH